MLIFHIRENLTKGADVVRNYEILKWFNLKAWIVNMSVMFVKCVMGLRSFYRYKA